MKCFRLVRSVLVVSLVCLAGTIRADLVPNGGFDTDLSGWTQTGDVTWLPSGLSYSSPEGGSARCGVPTGSISRAARPPRIRRW